MIQQKKHLSYCRSYTETFDLFSTIRQLLMFVEKKLNPFTSYPDFEGDQPSTIQVLGQCRAFQDWVELTWLNDSRYSARSE